MIEDDYAAAVKSICLNYDFLTEVITCMKTIHFCACMIISY